MLPKSLFLTHSLLARQNHVVFDLIFIRNIKADNQSIDRESPFPLFKPRNDIS